MNNPLIAVLQKSRIDARLPDTNSFVSVSQLNIVVTAIKKAYDGNGTIIRLVEMEGKDTKAEIYLPSPVYKLYQVNLPEEDPKPIENPKEVLIKTYGIETFLVRFC